MGDEKIKAMYFKIKDEDDTSQVVCSPMMVD